MLIPKILVVPGSLRTDSHDARLAALAAKQLALTEVDVTRLSLADYPLPWFDADESLEGGLPPNVLPLRRMLESHQGVFLASAEYSASVTPILKNAIDWLSRPRARGEAPYAAFKNRVFAIGAASPGAGGLHALIALRQILEFGCGALVIPEQVVVVHAAEAFDQMGHLKDESLAGALKAMTRRLVDLAGVIS